MPAFLAFLLAFLTCFATPLSPLPVPGIGIPRTFFGLSFSFLPRTTPPTTPAAAVTTPVTMAAFDEPFELFDRAADDPLLDAPLLDALVREEPLREEALREDPLREAAVPLFLREDALALLPRADALLLLPREDALVVLPRDDAPALFCETRCSSETSRWSSCSIRSSFCWSKSCAVFLIANCSGPSAPP